jgi:hypothetical protein
MLKLNQPLAIATERQTDLYLYRFLCEKKPRHAGLYQS